MTTTATLQDLRLAPTVTKSLEPHAKEFWKDLNLAPKKTTRLMNNMWQARAFQCLGLFILSVLTPAWDPNAGVVTSYSKLASSRITASSNSDDATQANDGNDTTHWTSFGCLPYFYLDNPLTNVLHNACQQGRCNSSSGQ